LSSTRIAGAQLLTASSRVAASGSWLSAYFTTAAMRWAGNDGQGTSQWWGGLAGQH
jgi:hypothetical protein